MLLSLNHFREKRMKFLAAAAQIGPTLGNLDANRELLVKEVKKAEERGVDLLVFPELSLTGYFLKDMVPDVAVRQGDECLQEIAALSRRVSLVVGFVEESAQYGFFNSAAYFENGEMLHVHRKVYLPTYGLFDENRYMGAGDKIRAFDTRFGRSAVLICEDAWHPSLAGIASLDGADLLIVPSASPARGVRKGNGEGGLAIQRVWRALTRTYAAAYNQHVIFSNRVGYEDGIHFWGGSEILSPSGEPISRARRAREQFLVASIDTANVRRARISSPTTRDEDMHLTLRELRRIQKSRER